MYSRTGNILLIAFLGYVLPYGQMSLWGYFSPSEASGLSLGELYMYTFSTILPFSMPRKPAQSRVGPHNQVILSILIGTLLGDGSAEHRSGGTRVRFHQEDSHSSYLLFLHAYVASLGYCTSTVPVIAIRINENGIVRWTIRFSTFTYTSFNWLYEGFYDNGLKGVPNWLESYLTPIALAVWIMDDGAVLPYGMKLCTNSFTKNDCYLLCVILGRLYDLDVRVHSAGVSGQWHLYVTSASMPKLASIVRPHMHPSMLYKLGQHS